MRVKLPINKFVKIPILDEAVASQPIKPPGIYIKTQQQPNDPETWYNMLGLHALESAYGLPSGILRFIIQKESKGNPQVISQRGARGLFQIMPGEYSGFFGNPLDHIESAKYVASKLAKDKKDLGSLRNALAAYNWGRKNVINKGLEQAPPETRNFLNYFKEAGMLTDELVPDDGW